MSTQEFKNVAGPEQTEQEASGKSPEEAAPGGAVRKRPTAHESDLFPSSSGPRYFGTGSYEMGGSHAEGSDAIGEINPLGGYGTFTDAGGPGSETLYGEESSPVSDTPADVAPGEAEGSTEVAGTTQPSETKKR
jgi:hypothetical protein